VLQSHGPKIRIRRQKKVDMNLNAMFPFLQMLVDTMFDDAALFHMVNLIQIELKGRLCKRGDMHSSML
jgi:hypothetical protein